MSIQNPTATERRIVLMPIDALAAEIDALRAEVESWAQQADDRAKDAVRFAQERDEANAENAKLREALRKVAVQCADEEMMWGFDGTRKRRIWSCSACRHRWEPHETERHDPDCPAAPKQ